MLSISHEDVRNLLAEHQPPCISIYMPTFKAGPDVQQNPIRFRNLLRKVEAQLEKNGWRKPDAEALLKPAEDLDMDPYFWEHQSQGLAVFLSPDVFQNYTLPRQFDEQWFVGPRFEIKPLLPLFINDGRFYLLALSQDDVRLMEGDRFSIWNVDLENVPDSLADALRFDETLKHTEWHFGSGLSPAGVDSKPQPVYHTQQPEDQNRHQILRYFQKIDRGVKDLLEDLRIPLVLAGVEYLFPIYREANSYRDLLETGIPGNPEGMKLKQLHDPAWEIVEPWYRQGMEADMGRYRQAAGGEQASNRLEEIVPAAVFGRVDCLFVPQNESKWGTFDASTGQVQVENGPTPENVDLYDLAAAQTFLNRGRAYVVSPSEVPDTPVAAVFRY